MASGRSNQPFFICHSQTVYIGLFPPDRVFWLSPFSPARWRVSDLPSEQSSRFLLNVLPRSDHTYFVPKLRRASDSDFDLRLLLNWIPRPCVTRLITRGIFSQSCYPDTSLNHRWLRHPWCFAAACSHYLQILMISFTTSPIDQIENSSDLAANITDHFTAYHPWLYDTTNCVYRSLLCVRIPIRKYNERTKFLFGSVILGGQSPGMR